MSRRTSGLILALALTVLAAVPLGAAQKKQATTGKKTVVCWTDATGQRSCGDSIPPQEATSDRTVIDAQGRTKTIPGAPTPEERAAQEAAEQQAAEDKRIADQAAANDRSLLATYSKPEEIAALRNDRLMTLDASARITAKGVEKDQASLDSLRASLAKTDAGNTKDPKILKEIGMYEAALSEKKRVLASMGENRVKLCSTFDRDIRRFQELKSGQVTFESPCPPPDSLAGADVEADLKAARKAFDGFAASHHARSASVFDQYAADATIRYLYLAASGNRETAELTPPDYRDETVEAWKKLKPGTPGPSFSDISVEPGKNGAAKVSAKLDTGTESGKKFWVVMRPVDGKWRIVEQWSEARF